MTGPLTRRFHAAKPVYAIVPMHDPRDDGAWTPCRHNQATRFYVELRGQVIQGFDTFGEATDYVAQHSR